jgi:dihydrofolate reductase
MDAGDQATTWKKYLAIWWRKLTTTFINLGLIDIHRLAVHPVILGSGKSLFESINSRVGLRLTDGKSKSGVVLLT